ncbi:hypothetical protein OYT88_06220 [Sporolactobacillus sp. CQH2019]|uniref:terminase gpP N-terminus-related DNA-binding protein n=1 Tax=Sporolactobacillus sp. CQH2019 TaxID=3023512 RepID=UPI0023683F19|nr:hypothetical protein [Sporolactobacillus sp. CQH2019]MDD9148142.1 hypothetical protein [Sporolactobacillus sp. CQH2019]
MDREKAAQVRLEICHLLDQCGTCPKRYSYSSHTRPEKKCGTCKLYAKIRDAGERLAAIEEKPKVGNPTKLNMSRGQYFDYRRRGFSDEEIADEIGIHRTTLSSWKHRNGIRKRQLPASDQEIIDAYLSGLSMNKIEKKMHCGRPHIYKILNKHGIGKRADKK